MTIEAKRNCDLGDWAWGGSVERSHVPMHKNRIRGAAEPGRAGARPRSSLWSKAEWLKFGGSLVNDGVLTWGDLA